MPGGTETIGDSAFYKCTGLKVIKLPDGVKSIGDSAFSWCNNFISVTIPAGITSIGSGAFSGCKSLTSLTIPGNVTNIGDGAFKGCNKLTKIDVVSGSKSYASVDCELFSKDKATIICLPTCKSGEYYEVPSETVSIGDGAFKGCDKLDDKGKDGFAIEQGTLVEYTGNEQKVAIPAGVKSDMEAETKKRRSLNYKIAITGVFAALSVILSVTPLGYIRLGDAIYITLIPIPMILAALLGGLASGVVVGFAFSLSELLYSLMIWHARTSTFFLYQLADTLRLMVATAAVWAIYKGLCLIPHLPKTIAAVVSAVVGTFIYRVLAKVTSCIFYPMTFYQMVRFVITMHINDFLAMAVAAFFVAAVFLALFAKNHGKSKESRFAASTTNDDSPDF